MRLLPHKHATTQHKHLFTIILWKNVKTVYTKQRENIKHATTYDDRDYFKFKTRRLRPNGQSRQRRSAYWLYVHFVLFSARLNDSCAAQLLMLERDEVIQQKQTKHTYLSNKSSKLILLQKVDQTVNHWIWS